MTSTTLMSVRAAILLVAASAAAHAQEPALTLAPAGVTLQPQPIETSPSLQEHPENQPSAITGEGVQTGEGLRSTPAGMTFGEAKSKWWGLGVGAATNGEDTDMNLYGRYEYFIAQNVELFGELGGWTFSQEGKDAFAVNTSLVIRYHWFNNGRTTIFVDGGIGLLFSSDPVNRSGSDDGTSFNFTPRLGGGVTHQLTDEGVRLEVGLRWAHVSNARISGANDNPGRDSGMIYAGLIFPF